MQFGQEPLKPTHQVPGIGDGLVILPHVFQIEADTPVYLFRNRWNTYILIIQVSEKMPYCPDSFALFSASSRQIVNSFCPPRGLVGPVPCAHGPEQENCNIGALCPPRRTTPGCLPPQPACSCAATGRAKWGKAQAH